MDLCHQSNIFISVKVVYFWECSQNQFMKPRDKAGQLKGEYKRSWLHRAPIMSTLRGCPLHLVAGERAAQVSHAPDDTWLQRAALQFSEACLTPALMPVLLYRRSALSQKHQFFGEKERKPSLYPVLQNKEKVHFLLYRVPLSPEKQMGVWRSSFKLNKLKKKKKDELPSLVGANYASGDQWRNNSRKNEGMEQSKNNTQLWMWLVLEARSDAVKSNIT